jgi:hypothetical protein
MLLKDFEYFGANTEYDMIERHNFVQLELKTLRESNEYYPDFWVEAVEQMLQLDPNERPTFQAAMKLFDPQYDDPRFSTYGFDESKRKE